MTGVVNTTGARSGILGTITAAAATAISTEAGTWTPAGSNLSDAHGLYNNLTHAALAGLG